MGWYDGMDDTFASRLKAFIAASRGRVSVVSGYRSIAVQEELWADALREHGSEDAARMWVAPPGKSNHNHGIAADLDWQDEDTLNWMHSNASRFGLTFPMSWEPWHIETVEARGGSPNPDGTVMSGGTEAYTTPPDGATGVTDAPNRFDLGYQLEQLNGLLMNKNAAQNFLAGKGGQSTEQFLGGPTGAEVKGDVHAV